MEIVKKGYKDSRKRFKPPKSPKDFAWPTAPTAEDKRAFGAALKHHATERGLDRHELAKVITGVIRNNQGNLQSRDGGSVRKWWHGVTLPREETATMLAAYFRVPVADLLKPRNGAAVNGHVHAKGNGHGEIRAKVRGAKPSSEDAVLPALALPESAKPAFVKLESFPEDSRFVTVFVTGTMPLDQALSVMALVHPRSHG